MSRKKRNPTAPAQKYRCQWQGCDHTASTPSLLDRHLAIHSAPEHVCPDPGCGVAFTQRWNLITHIRTVHHKIRSACTYCGKSFSSQSNVAHHINRIHKPKGEVPNQSGPLASERSSKLRNWKNIDLKELLDGNVPYPEPPVEGGRLGYPFVPSQLGQPSLTLAEPSSIAESSTSMGSNRMSLGFLCEPVDTPVKPQPLGEFRRQHVSDSVSLEKRYTPYRSTSTSGRRRASTVSIPPISTITEQIPEVVTQVPRVTRHYAASERMEGGYDYTSYLKVSPVIPKVAVVEKSPVLPLTEAYGLSSSLPVYGEVMPRLPRLNLRIPTDLPMGMRADEGGRDAYSPISPL